MTDPLPETTGPDGIEAGKRLIRQSGGKGLSLAERLSERLERLTWRTPFHALRLRGKHPLKLIAVADDPFFGDLERGYALLDGMVLFRGEAVPINALSLSRPSFSAPFADYLHSFAWLRDLSSVATRATAAPIAEAIMRHWLAAHETKVSNPAWRADLWGRRLLFWTAHAPLILSSTDLVYRSKVLHALARGARHLDNTAAKVAAGVPRVAAWCGVVAAGLMIPGGDPRRVFGEAGLARALAAAVFEDGGSLGRSPADQLDLIQLLTMLRETYAARRMEAPDVLGDTLTRLVSALLGVCHSDGGLGSWQGSAPITGERIEQIVEATGVRTRPLRQARDWGYQRLSAGKTVVVLDAAPPPANRQATGGCASTLAFELSDAGQRIVVNCGGANGALLTLPPTLAPALRTTAAHSTLVLGDSNSTAIHADGALGRGVGEVELSRQETDELSRVEASHDGYVRRLGLIHRRLITLSTDGRDLVGEDTLLPASTRGGSSGKQGDVGFTVRFHLGLGVEVATTADGLAAFLRLPDGRSVWQFRCRGAALAVEDSLWIDGEGIPHGTQQLVLTGIAPPGGAGIGWRFHRAR
ncbi:MULTISPECIES: heparinase II/III domain-containing protein [Sphingomonas]|uniref:Heparinase II/III family protein n=1 Tax=Sphingomonas molluscorum TaxID=418184 RepID=A0ABU8Q0T6_9SPHN|nr:putative heparinase superfamily protein [Sphingomonas sp. JUb134]